MHTATYVKYKMPLSNRAAASVCAIITVVITGLLLTVILVPLSFSYVGYTDLGLVKGRTTGKVKVDRVYTTGRYRLGPASTFQKYRSDANIVQQNNVSIVSQDKLETDIDVTFIYFINPAHLGDLQREFNLRYQTVVESRAISALKNAAVSFTTLQYFQNRSEVHDALLAAIQDDLEANLYVTVPFLFLAGLRIPQAVADKQLQTAIQEQVNLQQLYDNQAALTRKDTDQLVNAINNNATVTVLSAAQQANSLVAQATANATRTVETARTAALKRMFTRLNVSDAANATTKQRLDYVLTLLQSDVQLHLGYDTLLRTST